MARIFIIAILAVLNTACGGLTLQTTINPGVLQVGFDATYATDKQRPVCSNSSNTSWSNKTTSSSDYWSCTQVFDLGNDRCTRSWTEYRSNYNPPGKKNDSGSFSQYNNPPSCRPMTPTELAERAERRRQAAEAARAASATKK